ncbi:hypothetical protein L083_3690 [Actinoplanes sp. N902-109]|nr:hypothetical protein L083_3690 [Actinoplanes sp. N902-109]
MALLAGVLIVPGGRRGHPPPREAAGADPAVAAVDCLRQRRALSPYLVVVMLIAQRDRPAVPGLAAQIRRGVAGLDRAYHAGTGDAGLLTAAFALAARAEIGTDPAAAEAHYAAAADLVERAAPGGRALGATELARTARAFGDPRAADWQRLAGPADLPRGSPVAPPHCAFDRATALSRDAVHQPVGEQTLAAALLSPRRS